MVTRQRAVAPGTDDNEFGLVSEFKGYVSSVDPTNSDPAVLVRGSQNVYKKISGTIANRFGKKLYDATTDATITGIKSGCIWNTSKGQTYPIRVANGKLQVESAVTGSRVWYDLLTSLTLTRFVFDPWWDNTDKKDLLVMVNGGTNVYNWSGGFGLFVSAVANTSITLSSDATVAGFASTGTVTINGNDYPYTGISGSTLTGVTGDASAQAANSVVMQKINTTANSSLTSGPATEFVNDFIKVIGNQLYLGSYTSRLVYISKNSTFKDFSQSSPRLTGEGEILTLDDFGRGIGVRQGNAHIFAGTSFLYIVKYTQITVGTSLSEQVNVDKIQLGNLVAAQAHEFIDVLSDNIIYLDQANQLRGYGTYRNLFKDKAALLSQAVQDELNDEDFTNGQLKVISDRRGDLIYIIAPNSGKTYIYQERSALDSVGNVISERIWQPPQIWSISRIDSIAGSVVGFSNANPQIYYLWDTNQYYDDSPSGSQIPYQSIALWAYQNGGRRQGKLVFDKIYYEGYATQNSNLYGGIYLDYEGSTGMLSPIINDSSSFLTSAMLFTGAVPPSLGDASLGDNPLGDGLNILPNDQALVPKFRTIIGITQVDCFEYALMVYSTNAGARWEMLALGSNSRLSISEAVEIVK